MNEGVLDTHSYPPEVTLQIDQEDEKSYAQAAKAINARANETIVIVQHEYGIFGGKLGDLLINFLDTIECPIIATLHTVSADPSQSMQDVTSQIIYKSDKLIVQTDSSYKILTELYPGSKHKIVTIKHGIHPLLYKKPDEMKPRFKLNDRKVLLTFGLLSRNKGIEHIIASLPKVVEKIPNIMYLVVGATHPSVIRHEGESYRFELMQLVKNLSLQMHVKFVDDFLPVQDILEYLQATDIYIATSLDPHQAVSGTLSYALGAERAVITTNFAQAREIVTPEIGRIVPMANPPAVSKAILELLTNPDLLIAMSRKAYSETRSMLWSNVANEYTKIIASVASLHNMRLQIFPELNWQHLLEMTASYGMLQFSKIAVPDSKSGYTLDDNSRALQLVTNAYCANKISKKQYNTLYSKYLKIINICLSQTPTVNYLSASNKHATKQNLQEDLSDSLARAYYALQTTANTGIPKTSMAAKMLLAKLEPHINQIDKIRPITQILLGAAFALNSGDESAREIVVKASDYMVKAYHKNSTAKWKWFDETMTYANGQMCSALIESAIATKSKIYSEIGLESLEFLCQTCFMGEVYAPIGQNGWYNRDGTRALFDQQPEDTFSTIQALESAFKLTGDNKYIYRAEKVFSWFLGNNLIGTRLYDDKNGGCRDGLKPEGVNLNEGSESTLSYLGARLIMERLRIEN